MTNTPHILAIDDEPAVTLVIKRTLENAGYTVSALNDSTEALNEIEAHRPDLILLDIKMPDQNGFETLEKIKAIYSELPVIMLTAIPDAVSVDKSLNLGAEDYIRKPFRSGELTARIKAKLRRIGKS